MIGSLSYFEIFEYFLVYAFLGWCVEVVYQAVSKGLIINRGFIDGPLCPIYGVGVIGVVMILDALYDKPVDEISALSVFAFGIIFATSIELFGGWAMDKIFHARWWDYRSEKYNLNGYICLKFSLIWGLGIVLVIRVVYPFVSDLLSVIKPNLVTELILAGMYIVFAADITVTALIMAGLNKRFRELDEIQKEMRVVSDALSTRLATEAIEKQSELEQRKTEAQAELESRRAAIQSELEKGASRFHLIGIGRIMNAYPDMRHRDYDELLQKLKKRTISVRR